MKSEAWSIVLAAGDGTRLRSMTSLANGTVVPKQFCAFGTGRSLMTATLERSRRLAPPQRTLAVVAEDHRGWWSGEVGALPPGNVVVQPRNRGTAPGILLPLLHVMSRDPAALIALLPSDHHVAREDVLLDSVAKATRLAARDASGVFLLGITPDGPETEYGWIVPSSRPAPPGSFRVGAFVEKPDRRQAAEAMADGASWSSFIIVGRAGAFLDLYRRCTPGLLRSVLAAWRRPEPSAVVEPWDALRDLYDVMQPLDFSRDVLQHESVRDVLRLVPVPACGWSDLGTPARLTQWLHAGATA